MQTSEPTSEKQAQIARHTPGPWQVVERRDAGRRPVFEILGISGTRSVADLLVGGPNEDHDADGGDGRADANLIAAAPELLDALKAALPFIDAHRRMTAGDGDLTAALMRHAISKAEGGAA